MKFNIEIYLTEAVTNYNKYKFSESKIIYFNILIDTTQEFKLYKIVFNVLVNN